MFVKFSYISFGFYFNYYVERVHRQTIKQFFTSVGTSRCQGTIRLVVVVVVVVSGVGVLVFRRILN